MTKIKEMPNVAEESVNQEQTLSPEELAKRRTEITSFYKENIKSLKVQLEYEELLTSVEKTRAERLQAQIFVAQTISQQQGGMNPEGGENPAEDFETAKSRT